MEGFFLTPGKMAALNRILERELRRPITSKARYSEVPDVIESPDVYIARTPMGGIPGLDEANTGTTTDDVPGAAECDIFKLKFYDPDGTVGSLYSENWYLVPAGFKKLVFNLGTSSLNADQWITVFREKFGRWIAGTQSQGTAGSTIIASHVGGWGNQSVNGGTPLRVKWSGDDSVFWNNSSPTKFTVPVGYPLNTRIRVYGTGHFLSTNVQKDYGVRWLKNQTGTPSITLFDSGGACSSGPIKMQEGTVIPMSPGEFVELFAFHNDETTRTFYGMSACCESLGVA